MNAFSMKLCGWISVTCLCVSVAKGSVDGSFKYVGCDIEFRNGQMGSSGETKSILTESIDVTAAADSFTAIMDSWVLSRSITNHPVEINPPVSDIRLYNAYVVEMAPESGSISGALSVDSNLMMKIIPEGDGPVPFYFNSGTNVALSLSESEQSLGAGLLIRKSTGMSAASVSGSFVRYTLSNTFRDPEMYGWGYVNELSLERSTMIFDGAGGYTETGVRQAFSRRTNEREEIYDAQTVIDTYFTLESSADEPFSDSSTYSVESDGKLLISTSGGTIANQMSPDGNLAASALCMNQGTYSAGAHFTVALKQPQNMSTNAIDAVYFLVEFGEYFDGNSPDSGLRSNGVETGRTYLYLHADHTFSLRSDLWEVSNHLDNIHFHIDGDPASGNFFTTQNRGVIELDHGTYSISSNGAITLQFSTGDAGIGQLSENGEYVLYGNSEVSSGYAGHSLGVGVRRSLPSADNSVGFGAPSMTPSGIDITLAVPVDTPIEIINTSDLTSGEWSSSGIFTNEIGTLQFHDADAVGAARRFYSATRAPW